MSRTPSRLRDERGFMLIEVLVSAVILVTASLAIFATLTRADSAAGNQQVRVEAANFAQSELERIRALPVQDVMDFANAGTRTIKRNGIPFKETVVAKWVSDGDDEPQCTGQDGGLDYMRTTVTLSWPGMGDAQARPVSITSLFTPNAGSGGNNGSISVHIINRDGAPVADVPVNVKGRSSGGTYNGNTNKNGCVVFGFIPQDTYDLTAQKTGYVDQDSNPVITDAVIVTATNTSKEEYSYDTAGFTAVSFRASWQPVGTGLVDSAISLLKGATTVPSYPSHMQFFNAGQSKPGFDVDFPKNVVPAFKNNTVNTSIYSNPSNEVSSWDGRATLPQTGLYPFADPYSVYAGTCKDNAMQGSAAKLVNIPRLAFQNTGALDMPTLQIIVRDGTGPSPLYTPGNLVGGARVMVSFGCASPWTAITASGPGDPNPLPNSTTTNLSAGVQSPPDTSPWGKGTLADPGFPYSANIRACAYDPTSGRYSTTYAATNTNPSNQTNTLVIYTKANGYTTSPPTVNGTPAPAGNCMVG